MNIGGNQA